MKNFIVKVSEELTHTYIIEAEDKGKASELALNQCDEGIQAQEVTRDRVEVIDIEPIELKAEDEIADMILEVANINDNITYSDLQGIALAKAKEILSKYGKK